MAIDLSKTSEVLNAQGQTPAKLVLETSYAVAQGKGFGARLAGKLGGKLDLDALLLCFNQRNEVISVAGPEHLAPFGPAVVHHGDAKAGSGGNATESITVIPAAVPGAIKGFVLAVVSYGNSAAFGKLSQLSFSLKDGDGNELAHDYLTIEGGVQGQMLFKLTRDGDSWLIAPFSRSVGQAGRWEDVAQAARSELARA